MTLFVVRAIYLGSEPMGELLDGENGSDAVQVPLKRTILRTEGVGEEVDIIITDDSLCINYIQLNNNFNENNSNLSRGKLIQLPIETLAYCGALRQLSPEKVKEREFETLDKTTNDSKAVADPPLFVTIFRSLEKENTLLCHSFVIRKDIEAMELVKNVMQVYYNIIEQLEQTEALFNNASQQGLQNQNNLTQTELDRLLEAYNRTDGTGEVYSTQVGTQSILNNHGSSQFVVDENGRLSLNASKKDLTNNYNNNNNNNNNNNIDASQYNQIIKEALNEHPNDYSNVPLNQDDDPIIIKKKNEEKLVYKQNVYIRWLQPPTPPPPAPIIIREVPEQQAEQLPPVVIYKQAPRPITPPPLVIREKPPTPIQASEPIIIERRVPPQEQPRRVIVEEIPAPPQKPRDIILEKWLPREKSSKRPVVIEKLKEQQQRPPVYEYVEQPKAQAQPQIYQTHKTYDYTTNAQIDPKYTAYNRHPIYDVVNDKYKGSRRVVKQIIRPAPAPVPTRYYDYNYNYNYSDNYRKHDYVPTTNYNNYYNTNNQIPKYNRPRLAGYRIIRQIIPGPNATSNDIEKALIRSQQLGEQHQQSLYPKYVDNNNYIYSNNYNGYNQQANNYYYNGNNSYPNNNNNNNNNNYYNYSRNPVTVDQMYVPHKSSSSTRNVNSSNNIYKSSSIDQ